VLGNEGTKTGSSAATEEVENKKALEATVVIHKSTDFVRSECGVVAPFQQNNDHVHLQEDETLTWGPSFSSGVGARAVEKKVATGKLTNFVSSLLGGVSVSPPEYQVARVVRRSPLGLHVVRERCGMCRYCTEAAEAGEESKTSASAKKGK
jgi:hypothetical protein